MAAKQTFWSECRKARQSPPGGWRYGKWPKTESSFTLSCEECSISVMNGKDFCAKYPDHTVPEDKKLFFVRVITPDSDENHRVPVEQMYESLVLTCETINKQRGYSPELSAPPSTPKANAKKNPIHYIPPEPFGHVVGSFVKVVDGPYPEVMKKTVQRIDKRRENEAYITHWYSRRNQRVGAWVPLNYLELQPDYKPLRDSCLKFGVNTPGSAPDAYSRQHCMICTMKPQCEWYQREVVNGNG